MVKQLTKLIDVKSIVTFLLTIGFILSCFFSNYMTEKAFEQLSNIYMIVIAFYFGTQSQKDTRDKKEE